MTWRITQVLDTHTHTHTHTPTYIHTHTQVHTHKYTHTHTHTQAMYGTATLCTVDTSKLKTNHYDALLLTEPLTFGANSAAAEPTACASVAAAVAGRAVTVFGEGGVVEEVGIVQYDVSGRRLVLAKR